MQQAQMNFNPCIFDHFEIPASNAWAYQLSAERDEQLRKDVEDIIKLIDKYSK